VLSQSGRRELSARAHGQLLEVRRVWQQEVRVLWANFGPEPARVAFEPGRERLLIGALDAQTGLAPDSAVIVARGG
jgi:hypothetical protein